MNGRTRYADLIRQAGTHVLAANVALETAPPLAAELAAYRDLLHALGQHGLRLLGGESGRRWIRGAVVVEQSDIAGMQLTDHLLHVGQRSYADHADNGVIAHWHRAADAVRAASDLLATHLDTWGTTRAPESEVLNDPAVRAAGFGELASLAVPVAGADGALGRQLRDSGAAAREVEHLVPATGPLREAAVTSRGLAQLGGLGRPLAELQVARPAVRDQNPIAELQDRVARLHRAAHQLTREDWVGVCTLADLAVAGILLNDAAAKVLRAAAPADVPDLSIQRDAGRFEAGAAAWLEVHSHVRVLRTATPAIAAVRADVVAVRELVKGLGKAEPTRELQTALVGGARRFVDVAACSAKALDVQARSGRVMIPGRDLTGDQVSDDPILVRAKLQGLLVPALTEHVEDLRGAYGQVRAMVSEAVQAGPAATPLASLAIEP